MRSVIRLKLRCLITSSHKHCSLILYAAQGTSLLYMDYKFLESLRLNVGTKYQNNCSSTDGDKLCETADVRSAKL